MLGTMHVWDGEPVALVCPQDFSEGTASSCSPQGAGALLGDGTTSSARTPLPSLPGCQRQPQPSQLTCLVLCTTNPCPSTLLPIIQHSPQQNLILGHEATSNPGSLSPLLATHTTQCCTLICTSIPKLVHEEECEQTQTPPAPLLPQIPPSIEEGLLASRSGFSQLHIYLRIPAKEATKVLETSPTLPPPPTPRSRIFTPHTPTSSPSTQGEQLPMSRAQLPSALSFFLPSLPSVPLLACLRLSIPFPLHLLEKVFFQKKMQSNQKRCARSASKTC